jgi:ApaG protein
MERVGAPPEAAYVESVASQNPYHEPDGLRVTVDQVLYQPDAPTPVDRPHCFVYCITIHNDTEVAITIKGRKWVVRNAHGETTAVEGDGVVGQFPTILPGKSFCYNSFHLLDTPSGLARGSYLGIDSTGRCVLTRIPPFEMIVPA